MALQDTILSNKKGGSLSIGIVGLGYVGLPLAEAYCSKDVNVIGYDISQKRVDILNSGKSGMKHIEDTRVSGMVDKGLFIATADPSELSKVDAILIAVPTPLDRHHQPDLSYVLSTCETLKEHIRKGQIVILESTTFPGTTSDYMRPILEKSGLKAGVDFGLAYSPEREDPGNKNFDTATIPKVVGADSEAERLMAEAVYNVIVEVVLVSNTRTAEATKLVENIFRWVNIAMVNEMKTVFEKMDIDIWEVINAAKTKPFGFMPFYPGPGVGGHCIRIDPYYLSYKAREHGISTRFIELAGEVNIRMPEMIVTRLIDEMSQRTQKALSGSRVLLCGIAYKKDIDDMRESPASELAARMISHGAHVDYHDPYIPEIEECHEYPELKGMKSVSITKDHLKQYDACIIATAHSKVDYELLVRELPLVLDTRNATNDVAIEHKGHVVKA